MMNMDIKYINLMERMDDIFDELDSNATVGMRKRNENYWGVLEAVCDERGVPVSSPFGGRRTRNAFDSVSRMLYSFFE